MKTKGTFNAATALYFDFLEPTLSSKLPTSVDVKKLILEYKKFLIKVVVPMVPVTSENMLCMCVH